MAQKTVIAGGGMIGASVAWWLSRMEGFDGTVHVIEMDPSYANASSTHTNSCMRQQFGSEINIRLSQFTADFIRDFRRLMPPGAPDIPVNTFGYMYLATSAEQEAALRAAQALQAACGARTRILSRDQIAATYPFYQLDDIRIGSHNTADEGYFDGSTIFDWFRRGARIQGVSFIQDRVTGLEVQSGRIRAVRLAGGTTLPCDILVNATGPRAAEIPGMAGLTLPVEPRKRYTFVIRAAEPLDRPLPLTIDPSGVHMRSDGLHYMVGCAPDDDQAVEPTDFEMDHTIWEEKAWPAIATRIPAFERVKVVQSWTGHYAYNTLDQNAIIGPHPDLPNLVLANGFSGHGLQQAPGIGRGIAEWIHHGSWRMLDLSPLSMQRIVQNRPLRERNVI